MISPVVMYGLGAVLVVFGAARAIHMGWRRRNLEIREGEEAPRRKQGPRYHLTWGLVQVAMGLFLIISTYLNTRR